MPERYIGIDVGAETVKIAELTLDGPQRRLTHRDIVEHHRQPGPYLVQMCTWHPPGTHPWHPSKEHPQEEPAPYKPFSVSQRSR